MVFSKTGSNQEMNSKVGRYFDVAEIGFGDLNSSASSLALTGLEIQEEVQPPARGLLPSSELSEIRSMFYAFDTVNIA